MPQVELIYAADCPHVPAALILIDKFGFGSDPALYSGIAVFMGAAVWNVWPRVQRPCLACVPAGQGVQLRGNLT